MTFTCSGAPSSRVGRVLWAIAAAIALAAPPGSASGESDDLELDASIRGGMQDANVRGDDARFNQYRNVHEDPRPAIEEVLLRAGWESYFLGLSGIDLFRDHDRSAALEVGQYGVFELDLAWDEMIHHFAEDVPFLGYRWGGDSWLVSTANRLALQPNFPLGGNPPNSPTAAGVSDLLGMLLNAPRLDLAVERSTGTVDLEYALFSGFVLRGSYLHRHQDGLRALSSGGYRRDSDGALLAGGVGENFTNYGLEFPEPIDNDTDEVGAGFDYRGTNWSTTVDYRFVNFSNDNDTVTWDNPLRFTSANNLQGGAALNRLDLSPSSWSHTATASAGVWDLPLDSRLTVTGSWGRIRQDDPFPAFTVNNALTVVGGPNAGRLGATLPLPASHLDGQVDTILVNALASSRPIDPLSLNLKVNYYDYDNNSRRIVFPDGWARVAESQWSEPDNAGVVNRVPSWRRLRSSADAAYEVNERLTLIADYLYEVYWRNSDRNADTGENIVGGRVNFEPVSWANLRAGYHWSERSISGLYRPEPAHQFYEWERLRMFDQSDRMRNDVDVYLGFDPIDRLSFGLSFNYRADDYDEDYYGLHDRDGWTLGVDGTWAICDRATVSAFYSRDDFTTRMLLRAKSSAAGGGDFAVPENDWITKIGDVANTVGGSVTLGLIPEKLTLELGADYSFARSRFRSRNVNFVPGVTSSSGTAWDWPNTDINTTQLTADLAYHWTDSVSTSIRYLYEDFELTDAFTDPVVPYGNPPDAQGNRLDYFIFLDANYESYTAHVLTFVLKFTY